VTTRDPRKDPRRGDIVQGFDKKQREVVQTWPRALAREVEGKRSSGEVARLPVGTLVSKLGRDGDEHTLRVETPGGQLYYRLTTADGEPPPFVDAPAGTPVLEVEYQSVGEKYSHMVARQYARLGMWRGWARGTVIRMGDDP